MGERSDALTAPPGAEALAALLDGLVPFCERLRDEESYRIEPGQILALHGLVLAMVERNQIPEDLRDLAPRLGPVVCSSPREQRDFARRFAAWIESLTPNGQREPDEGSSPDLKRTLDEVAEHGRRAWARALPWIVLGGVVILALACAAAYLLSPGVPEPKGGQTLEPEPGPVIPDGSATGVGTVEALRAAIVQTVSTLLRFLPGLLGAIAWFVFLILVGLWGLLAWAQRWWDREAELVLRRRAAAGVPRTTLLRIKPPSPWPSAARLALDRAAVGLLRRRTDPVPAAIDVAATLARTVRNLGLPEPVPAQRRVTPEYLVLIDRLRRGTTRPTGPTPSSTSWRRTRCRWCGTSSRATRRYATPGAGRTCPGRHATWRGATPSTACSCSRTARG